MQRIRMWGISMCFVLVLAGIGMAQDITGSISGEVKDPQGAVIAKAKVTLTNTDKNVVVKAIQTDSSGSFVFPGLEVGRYAIAVTAPGFAAFEARAAFGICERWGCRKAAPSFSAKKADVRG
jgi:hypothetical protein